MSHLQGAGTLSSMPFRSVLDGLAELGLDVPRIMTACGLERARVEDPLARIDAELEHQLWALAEELSGDPAIGLRLGVMLFHRRRYHVLDYVVQHGGTVRRALQSVERFIALLDDLGHIQVIESDDLATVRSYRERGYRRAGGYIDLVCASSALFYRQNLPDFRFASVRLRRPQPKLVQPYIDVLGVTPRFGAEHNQLSFPRAFLDMPLASADPVLVAILEQHATELLQHVPVVDPLLARVQHALSEGFVSGRVRLPTIARAAGMSPRTLRRRLAALGTSFQEIVDGQRRDLACHRLRTSDDSVATISERLGFASVSAFQRAFQRWTRLAPSTYRERQRNGGSVDEQPPSP